MEDEPSTKRVKFADVPDTEEGAEPVAIHTASPNVPLTENEVEPKPEAACAVEVYDIRDILRSVEELQKLYEDEFWSLAEQLRECRGRLVMEATPDPENSKDEAGTSQRNEPQKSPQITSIPGQDGVASNGKDSSSSPSIHPQGGGETQEGEGEGPGCSPGGVEGKQGPIHGGLRARCYTSSGKPGCDKVVTFSEVEEVLLGMEDEEVLAQAPASASSILTTQHQKVLDLERLASTASSHWMDSQDAIACMVSPQGRYWIHRSTFSLGRCSETKDAPDVDLGQSSCSQRVCRQQAEVHLSSDGAFVLHNVGRREVLVDTVPVPHGSRAYLKHLSLLEVGGTWLLFMVNPAAVQRVLKRSEVLAM